MRPTIDALPEGYRLEEYVIESVLGRGGFGVTYRAHSTSLGVTVAIKEYFPQSLATRTARITLRPSNEDTAELFYSAKERFHREMQALARFRHPNIVRVSRVFQANDTYYAVLDYEDGPSLKSWRDSLQRRPTQHEIDVLLLPLLSALETIHGQGTIHRDIAPDNIIIRRDSSPVLIDFGAAKDLHNTTRLSTQAIVKHGFSPIEQYTGQANEQGPWTDIYALGATIYATLMDQPPPDASSRYTRDTVVSMNTLIGQGYRTGFLHAIDWSLMLHHDARPRDIAIWRYDLMDGAETTMPVARRAEAAGYSKPTEIKPIEPRWIEANPVGAPVAGAPPHGPVPDSAVTNYGGFGGVPPRAPDNALRGQAAAISGGTTFEPGFEARGVGRQPQSPVTHYGNFDLYRPSSRRSHSVAVFAAVMTSCVVVLVGIIALVPEARHWVAAQLPPAAGCLLDRQRCAGSSEFGGGGSVPRPRPIEPDSAERAADPSSHPAAPSRVGTRPAPVDQSPPANGVSQSVLTANAMGAISRFETCLTTNPCNTAGCTRAFEALLSPADRVPLSDRFQKAAANSQEACRSQREEGALIELKACVEAQPCDFETICLADFRSVIVGEPTTRAKNELDAGQRKAASDCGKKR